MKTSVKLNWGSARADRIERARATWLDTQQRAAAAEGRAAVLLDWMAGNAHRRYLAARFGVPYVHAPMPA